MPASTDFESLKRKAKAFRDRANELRKLANRPDPSSLRASLLSAAAEWDELAARALGQSQAEGV